MIQSFDYFEQYEVPNFILCNPNKEALYVMGTAYNTELKLKYNALSEFSFIIPEMVDGEIVPYFNLIEYRRLIHILGTEDLGYFIIANIKNSNDGMRNIKEVTAYSLEFELINKRVSKLSGTYQFYDALDPTETLLGTLIQYCPGWTIGTIDADLLTLWRTFDVSDTTIYNFLMTDCEQTFQCIFTFDTVAKTINAQSIGSIILDTDIYLSYENLLKNIDIDTITDGLCTALNVYGGGDLDIHLVNPLGTNTIYNFSYYMITEWMSQSLIDALTVWDVKVAAAQLDYANELTYLITASENLITQQSELVELQTQLTALEQILSAEAQQGLSLVATQALIVAKQAQIISKNGQISSTQGTITTITSQLTAIHDSLAFTNADNFTTEQFNELGNFIIGNTYQNQNFIQTDTMTTVEIQNMAQDLYDQAAVVLTKVSQPKYTFSLEAVNFVFLKDFLVFTNQLELGCVVTVEISSNTYAYPVLLEIDLQYDNPEQFNLIFGNRLRLDNNDFIYSDLFTQSISSGVSSGFNSAIWQETSTKSNAFTTFINSALDTAVNNVISSTDQNFIIDANGLRGRKLVSGVYDDEQIWLNNNVLVFTNDNWQSAKIALGKITVGSNVYYGLAADAVFGKIIAGNQLTIENSNNTFTLNGSGATLTNATLTVNSLDERSRITLNPNDGIKIQTQISGSWSDKFYVDSSGNLNLAGNLVGATGTFSGALNASSGTLGGWNIDTTGIYDAYGNYIRSNGQIKLGALTIDGSTASFAGTIYASNLSGTIINNQIANLAITAPKIADATITDAKIANISATKITAGTMSCDRLYGGTISWAGATMGSGGTGISEIHANNSLALYGSNSYITLNTGTINVYANTGINFNGYAIFNSGIEANGESSYSGFITVDSYGGHMKLNFMYGIFTGYEWV
jgi:hypothetical protein